MTDRVPPSAQGFTAPLPHLDYRWVFLASLLVSAWLIAWDPLINRDAIIYLRSADAYLQQGFAASQQEHGRPILSILMAVIHQLTGLPLLWGGLAIVTLGYAAMCTGFVATIHTLGGDRRIQLIAAIVILSHPMLNHNRSSIMRDPIYWGLLILSFRELLLYVRNPSWRSQLRWLAYVISASLFRFEGLFFATLAPLALLFTRDLEHRFRHCLHLLVPQLVAIAAGLFGILFYQQQLQEESNLFPAIEKYIDRLLALPGEIATVVAESAEPMLQFSAREDAGLAVLAGLVAVLLINICRAMTWPWVLALVWGKRSHLLGRFRSDDAVLLRAHILICLVYLSAFMLINRFMLERYGNQLVIFLLLYIPFVASALWSAGAWKKYLIVILLVGMSADSLHTGDRKKAFIREAAEWVQVETPGDVSLVTNEKYIAYFSQREIDWQTSLRHEFQLERLLGQSKTWRDKDYLVIYIKRRNEDYWSNFLRSNGLEEQISFGGGSVGRVAVVAVER